MFKKILFPLFLLGFVLILWQRAMAAPDIPSNIIEVNTTDDELNTDGDCSLREAIEAANTDFAVDACPAGSGADTITFNVSTPATIVITNSWLRIVDGSVIAISGPGPDSSALVLSGGGSVRVLIVQSGGSLALDRITVADGSSSSGSGLINEGGIVNITNSTFANNHVSGFNGDGGGAIYNYGTMAIANSTFSGNSASTNEFSAVGGGIKNGGTLSITNSTFSGNGSYGITSSYGGGLFSVGSGEVNIINSTFSGNTVSSFNGISYGFDRGGGIYFNNSGEVNIINSTFSGNTAYYGSGGGLAAYSSAGILINIINSTFSSNGAPNGSGGGLYSDSSNMSLANNILANSDSGGDCALGSGTITDNGNNLVEDYSCGFLFGGDPLLGDLADNGGPTWTHALLDGSPAIDAGNPAGCTDAQGVPLITDQRGYVRHVDGGSGSARCDIGAYEFGSALPTATPTPPTPTNTPSPTPTFTPTPTLTPTPPTSGPIFLPIIIRPIPCFAGSEEVEPNNSASEATGPLCLNQNYLGTPDDNWDFFSFTLNSPGVITIDVTNHPLASETGAQVQLYYQTVSPGTKVGEALVPPYQIIYDGAAGTYYVLIFNDTDKCNPLDCSVQYTLRVSSE